MTDASIKQKALTAANVLLGTDHITLGQLSHQELMLALVHVVEQSEEFKQEVSDAVEEYFGGGGTSQRLKTLIIHKPDPLVEAWIEATGNTVGMEPLNAALEARGLEIRPCK